LADVIVYVASDERYNDEVPTQFLHMLLQAGKPVIVCLMKMKEVDTPALVAHFQKEVLARMPGGVVACMAIPHLTPDERPEAIPPWTRGGRAAPVRRPGPSRTPVVNEVSGPAEPPAVARARSVRWATNFLVHYQEHLLNVARHDLAALQGWRHLVQAGQVEFD